MNSENNSIAVTGVTSTAILLCRHSIASYSLARLERAVLWNYLVWKSLLILAQWQPVSSLPASPRVVEIYGYRCWGEAGGASCRELTSSALTSLAKDFVHLLGQLEVVVADAFDAVSSQVNDHLVPHVEPFGVVVHFFGH